MTSSSNFGNWSLRTYDKGQLKNISEELKIPSPITAILMERGFTDQQRIENFLNPNLSSLPSPFEMKDMQKSVEIVHKALLRKIPIVIYGDYDVDGATGAAVLVLFLKYVGAKKVIWCQPHRLRDGYGVHESIVLEKVNSAGHEPGILITVDCGISDNEQILRLKKRGFTIIVTDHHQPPNVLPGADAILNPLQADCEFPCKFFAGVGVAFYFIMGLRSYLRDQGYFKTETDVPNLKNYLDLVALGTIADMVPLRDENRILVKAGLEVMSRQGRPCFKALAELNGNYTDSIGTDDISYRYAPLLNAASRLDDAARSLNFLICEDVEVAREEARNLYETNKKRKKITQEVLEEAQVKASELIKNGYKTIVIASERWHQGVIGIVASQLVAQFNTPAIVFSISDGVAKGSGRSVRFLDLHEKMKAFEHLFDSFGGHTSAVGVTLSAAKLKTFQELFETLIRDSLPQDNSDVYNIVDWISPEGELFSNKFLHYYEMLEPFGVGNPEPVFACRGQVISPKIVGRSHLKFTFKKCGSNMEGIGFNLGNKLPGFDGSEDYEIIFHLNRNTFRGKRSWQLNTLDIQDASPETNNYT